MTAETALEPILLDVDLSVEEYDLQLDIPTDMEVELETAFKIVEGDIYEGEYAAIPSFDEQVFPTGNKLMKKDFEVTKIPVFRTSNPSGGNTVYIGGMF